MKTSLINPKEKEWKSKSFDNAFFYNYCKFLNMGNQALSKLDELEELIELAEKVSVNIDTMQDRAKKSRQNKIIISLILISLCVFGFKYYPDLTGIYNPIISIFYLVVIVFLGYLLFQFLLSDTAREEKIESENLILKDLLSMIHSYKGIVYNDISIVKKAVIDMRLNRIKFDQQPSKNVETLKKKKVVTT